MKSNLIYSVLRKVILNTVSILIKLMLAWKVQ